MENKNAKSVKVMCKTCSFKRYTYLADGKFIDNAGFSVIQHMSKTGDRIRIVYNGESTTYELRGYDLIKVD